MENPVETVVAKVLQIPIETINDDLNMRNTELWDSLKHMELIMSLEERFHIQLTFDEIVAMTSVRGIKRALQERGLIG